MAREDSPPDSPLSSVASSVASAEHWVDEDKSETSLRPSKRQKVEAASTTSSAVVPDAEPDHVEAEPTVPALDDMSDVSSDSSGDIPHSPVNARLDEEDFQEQVTACDWDGCTAGDQGNMDGCTAGDQGNMDRLVEHIHNTHIESRQKKYTCEWKTCTRKGLPHASGYALKAHMRSHTREKPFYCYLPECDRSFTRSDALAKHMRTVHETEALRPSDPIPKHHGAQQPAKSKLKIIIKTPQSQALDNDPNSDADLTNGTEPTSSDFTELPASDFDEDERELGSKQIDKLYRKLFWENKWEKEMGEELMGECKEWEDAYHQEWLEKEALLSQVIESEVDWHERRKAVLSGAMDVQVSGAVEPHAAEDQEMTEANGHEEPPSADPVENGLRPQTILPV